MTDNSTSRRVLLQTLGFGALGSSAGCLGNTAEQAVTFDGIPPGAISMNGTSPHFGVTPTRHSVQSNGPEQRPDAYWRFQTNGRFESTPAIDSGVVYAGNEDGRLYAIDGTTGSELWHYETDLDVVSSPAVVDGTVYVGSMDGTFMALDAADGTLQWTHSIPKGIYSSPAVVGDEIYLGGLDGGVYSFAVTDGELRWQHETSAPVYCSPAVDDQRVYIASYNRTLYALSRDDGSVAWQAPTDDFVYRVPAVRNGRVFVGPDGVTAFNLDTGERHWKTSGHRQGSFPAITESEVVVADSIVRAFDPTNGTQLWEFDPGNEFMVRTAIGGETVYVCDNDGGVYALALESGALRWELSYDGQPKTLAVVDDMLVVGGGDRRKSLFAFGVAE